MADDEAEPLDYAVDIAGDKIWYRVRSYRHTPFIVWAVLMFVCLVGAVAWDMASAQRLVQTTSAKLHLLTACALFLIPVLLLLRDTPDNLGHGPSAKLPTAALTLLVILATIVTLVHEDKYNAWVDVSGTEPEWILFVFTSLATVFVPLAWNAISISTYEVEQRHRIQQQNGAIEASDSEELQNTEAMGALIATLIVVAIGGLALAAGAWGNNIRLQAYIGVGLSFVVVAVFAIVIFLEPLSNTPIVKFLSRCLASVSRVARPLAVFYNSIDTFLVRVGAPIAGMEHRGMWARYLVLFMVLCPLCVLGWFLPPPFGLLPSVLAVIIALSVSRLWSWVEDDRALAAMTDFRPKTPYRTAMREDYRDETLLGFIFVFALMPIIMKQIHESSAYGSQMFAVPEGRNGFFDWIGFFGIELAKAVPIVDWAEIYEIGSTGDSLLIQMESTASRHAVFLARATVDLVLIAALLRAIGISNRNRQQKRLFRAGADPSVRHQSGLIDRLDVFVERHELSKAIRGTRKRGASTPDRNIAPLEAHDTHFNLMKLRNDEFVDFRRYNVDRLSELYAKSDNPLKRAFLAAISHQHPHFSLKARHELLEELAEAGRGEYELYKVLSLLDSDIRSGAGANGVPVESLRSILFELRKRRGLKEFKVKIINLMPYVGDAYEVVEMLVDIAGRSDPDDFQYTRSHAVETIVEMACASSSESFVRQVRAHLVALAHLDIGATTLQSVSLGLLQTDAKLASA